MNPNLSRLQPYPFEKLRLLQDGVTPAAGLRPINLSIGEPKHPTPELVKQALLEGMAGLAVYPPTLGSAELRESITAWLQRRYHLAALDPVRHVLPVNGSREALFAIAQVVVDGSKPGALVACPNPFYQIYEGAALLAGASPYFIDAPASNGFAADYGSVPDDVWSRVQLLYTCSPANPSGRVMPLGEWKQLFELSDKHGFVVASDECYSELYPDEAHPPLGALDAARQLGRDDFRRLVVFSSLSKRSNAPGMRSGFVAGDPGILKAFLLYRTYHGSAMGPAVQAASAAAWRDEVHVVENRRLYREKYSALMPKVRAPLLTNLPDGGFYFWIRVPGDDAEFTRGLYEKMNVQVLPGSFLGRDAHGSNPGAGFIRVALVAPLADCAEAMDRISDYAQQRN